MVGDNLTSRQSFTQGNASITRRFGGSGLGLKICKSLCEAMQGSITCSSHLGHGSTFSFTVNLPPCAQSQVEQTENDEKNEAVNKKPFANCKILLVDDNVVNQRVGTRMLTNLGCQVTTASDGLQCIEKWQAKEKEKEAFDLILMDCQMPHLDGFAATELIRRKEQEKEQELLTAQVNELGQTYHLKREEISAEITEKSEHQSVIDSGTITTVLLQQEPLSVLEAESEKRNRRSRIPIIALTASATKETKEQCLKSGMDACLTKPLNKALLMSTLQEFLYLSCPS